MAVKNQAGIQTSRSGTASFEFLCQPVYGSKNVNCEEVQERQIFTFVLWRQNVVWIGSIHQFLIGFWDVGVASKIKPDEHKLAGLEV